MKRRAVWPLLVLLGGCGGARPQSAGPVPRPADALAAIIDRDPLAGAQWGVLAVDLATGDTLLVRAPAVRFIPASTLKIVTTVAALDLLGPEYRWHTDLWTGGPIDSTTATLHGDLVVPGTGDPSLSPRWSDRAPLRPGPFEATPDPIDLFESALPDAGIRRVTGALVIDASLWDSTTVRASWMVDDLPFAYSATGGALTLAEGETRVEVRGGAAAGDPVAVRWWPLGEEGFVRSGLTTGGGDALDVTASYLPESRVLELTGTVPPGRVDTLAFATRDPVRQAAAALHRALVTSGAVIEGGWRIEWEPGARYGAGCVTGSTPPCTAGRLLRGLGSPPLVEMVASMLGSSQNWIAEQMIRTLGQLEGGRAGWDEGTAAAARRVEQAVGASPLDVRLVDGSGLSVQDLLAPRALVQILRYAHARPWGAAFRTALPEPGEEETTLSGRLLDLSGRVFAKTGSLTNVATLAGLRGRRPGPRHRVRRHGQRLQPARCNGPRSDRRRDPAGGIRALAGR